MHAATILLVSASQQGYAWRLYSVALCSFSSLSLVCWLQGAAFYCPASPPSKSPSSWPSLLSLLPCLHFLEPLLVPAFATADQLMNPRPPVEMWLAMS
jgi:hypothetical protein